MIARRAAAALACACLVALPSHSAPAASVLDLLERVEATVDSGTLPYAPDRAIVKYRHEGPDAVGECVESLLRDGRSFAEVTGAAGDSLDGLHERLGVVAARALFRPVRPGEDPSLAALQERRQARSAGPVPMSSLRSNRASRPQPPFLDHVYLLETDGATDVAALCAELSRHASVEYCHPDRTMGVSLVPDDSYFGSSGAWGQSYEDLWGLRRIRASNAWDASRGAGVVVAVVDTGLDPGHPDIAPNVWSNPGEIAGNGIDDDANGFVDDVAGWNFAARNNDPLDGHGHGTHVSGTVAAVVDNRRGIAGVAPESRILPVKGLRDTGTGQVSDLAQGIVYATDVGADVINNSWGSAYLLPADPVLVDAVRYAHSQGVVVVAAAGNSTRDIGGLGFGQHPAGIPEAIAVAASDHRDEASDFSNFGAGVDVTAPGGDSRDDTASTTAEYNNILSLRAAGTFSGDVRVVDGDYLRLRGTSMSTPHVVGLAALLLSLHPGYTVEEVRQAIRATAEDVLAPGWDERAGYGRIDASAALDLEDPLSSLITSPSNGDVVAGTVEVRGIAFGTAARLGENLAGYRLERGAGASPTAWERILDSTLGSPFERTLGEWAIPDDLPDGCYTLRLVATDDVGRDFESRVRVEADSHDPPELSGWPQEAPLALRQLAPMMPGVGDIDGDGDQEIFLGPLAWHHDGTRIVNGPRGAFTNHPVDLGLIGGYNGIAAVGDVDGDGRSELVQIHAKADFSAELLVFDEHGQLEAGWPAPIGRNGAFLRNASPVLADIDGDGIRDIVVANPETNRAVTTVDVYRGDGSLIHGLSAPFVSTNMPAVGDVDGDRLPEIVLLEEFGNVVIWNHDGSPVGVRNRKQKLQNYKLGERDRVIEDRTQITAPTIGDLDGDGTAEIAIVDTDGTVRLFDALSGRSLDGWPQEVGCCDASMPALADVDADGDLEVIVGDRFGRVHVWHHDGAYVEGWPRRTGGYANTTPAVGDLDGDGTPEVVTLSADGRIHAWDWRGNDLARQGWPVYTGEYYGRGLFATAFGLGASPVIADLDGDGDREVLAFTERVHVWDLPDPIASPPPGHEWPMFRFDRFGSADPARAADGDLDGVADAADSCPDTPPDQVADGAAGCSVPELCGCDAPPAGGWSAGERRAVLACVEATADRFRREGLVSEPERGAMVSVSQHACRARAHP